jgi:hypothetical protein
VERKERLDQVTPYFLSFEIPYLPETTNSGGRRHWTVKAAEAARWKQLVGYSCIGKKPPSPLTKATVTLTRYSASEPDFDGLVSSFKHVLDGLVECGVLADDKMSTIGQPHYKWEKVGRNLGKISVEVKASSAAREAIENQLRAEILRSEGT